MLQKWYVSLNHFLQGTQVDLKEGEVQAHGDTEESHSWLLNFEVGFL